MSLLSERFIGILRPGWLRGDSVGFTLKRGAKDAIIAPGRDKKRKDPAEGRHGAQPRPPRGRATRAELVCFGGAETGCAPTGSLQRVKKEKEVEHDNKLPGTAHPRGDEEGHSGDGLYRDDRDPAESDPGAAGGKEVIAKAPTGNRKTCAFGVPMVQRIKPERRDGRGCSAPYRSSRLQITEELQKLGKHPQLFHRGRVWRAVHAAADQRPPEEPADRGGHPRPSDGPIRRAMSPSTAPR